MNKRSLYALEAVTFIACKSGVSPVSLKEVCSGLGVTERYLEQTMQRLVHAGILRGVRGPKGGYVLAREKRKLTLKEIYEVVDMAEENFAQPPSILGDKVIKPLARDIRVNTLKHLNDVTISDLFERARGAGIIEKLQGKTADFNI